MVKGEERRIKIYFADEWPHGDKIDWIWEIIWMGSQMDGTIHIRCDMPWWLFWWVLIHEVLHVLDIKLIRALPNITGLQILSIHVSNKFWKLYERVSLLVAWRWSCKQKGLI